MKLNKLSKEEEDIILNKGTEAPYSGSLLDNTLLGTYVCKQCDSPLFYASDKFDSSCGWPAFDNSIANSIVEKTDADGIRTEIICSCCGGHLGHVFKGEGFTNKNIRHCVNSLSLSFIPKKLGVAYFASGCFWGTEYYMLRAKGIISTVVGYMGGHLENPTYEQVCTKTTGHLETTRIIFDDSTTYEELVKLFFETHDFTQRDGQGPDIGPQYRSFIFYNDKEQNLIAGKYINILKDMKYDVATTLEAASRFWPAEDYHQQYYDNKGGVPYCHSYKQIF